MNKRNEERVFRRAQRAKQEARGTVLRRGRLGCLGNQRISPNNVVYLKTLIREIDHWKDEIKKQLDKVLGKHDDFVKSLVWEIEQCEPGDRVYLYPNGDLDFFDDEEHERNKPHPDSLAPEPIVITREMIEKEDLEVIIYEHIFPEDLIEIDPGGSY